MALPIHIAVYFFAFLTSSFASRQLTGSTNSDSMVFQYHHGTLLRGHFSVNLIFYGNFKPAQRAILHDFITSLSSPSSQTKPTLPSVANWWNSVATIYPFPTHKPALSSSLTLSLGKQLIDQSYSLGKSLTLNNLETLASNTSKLAVNVVLTANDVLVEGFCSSRCGTHWSKSTGETYIWVGNSEQQCPGQCAWPFHKPVYGPQVPALLAPNNDVGVDGMVINLASLLAGIETNPFGNGYYQGPKEAPLEAATACPGVYGKGAYPGYPGDLLVDEASGASYNANGVNGRRFLVPALYDPSTSTCSTLV